MKREENWGSIGFEGSTLNSWHGGVFKQHDWQGNWPLFAYMQMKSVISI